MLGTFPFTLPARANAALALVMLTCGPITLQPPHELTPLDVIHLHQCRESPNSVIS